MLTIPEIRELSLERLRDARALLNAGRLDGAVYMAGYAVELALKARICRTLKWGGFPETTREFQGLQSVKTHDLEVLLKFSGVEARIKTKYVAEWSLVLDWDPQKRYTTSRATGQEAAEMVKAATTLRSAL